MDQPNRIKAAMRAGRSAYRYSLSFPSPWVIDILGKLDFDYVFIDGEHGPFGLDQLEDLCRTAERYNLTPLRGYRTSAHQRFCAISIGASWGYWSAHRDGGGRAPAGTGMLLWPTRRALLRCQPGHRLQCPDCRQGGLLSRGQRADAGLRAAGRRRRARQPGC